MARKVSLDPAAWAALHKGDAPIMPTAEPLPRWVVKICEQVVCEGYFGPKAKPSFRMRLLAFASFDAYKNVWACDHWQRKMMVRFGL